MKRFLPKETLLLCAPILLIGLGLWGAYWQSAQREARLPRVEGCFLRAPTAEEAFQGAKVTLACRSSWPEEMDLQAVTTVTNTQGQFNSQRLNWGRISRGGATAYRQENGRDICELRSMLNFENFAPDKRPTRVEQRLYSPQGGLVVKRTFQIAPQPPPAFEIASMRHTRGEIVRAQLALGQSFAAASYEIWLTASHSGKAADRIISLSHFNAVIGGSPLTSLDFDGTSSGSPKPDGTAQYNFSLVGNGLGRWAPRMKAMLDVSIEREWPLHLEIALPAKPPLGGKPVELRFTSRLAPIPGSSKSR